MGQYTSYWLYQKYEQRGSQEPIPVYPNIYSINGDGTMTPVVRIEDDPQCGYVPPVEPTYRWTNIPITQDYICDECGIAQYRWVNLDPSVDYYCEGTTKYYKQKRQVSYDGGVTWQDVSPAEYQKGGVAEEQSTDCGYIPPTPTTKKLVATYTGGTTREVECNGDGTLTSGETKPSGYQASAMTSAVIGDCVTSIGANVFWACRSLTRVNSDVDGVCNIPNSVTYIGDYAFWSCSGLTSIDIPDSVTSISHGAFEYCTSLTSLTLGSGVTSIGDWAFTNCINLTSVTIPNSVISIGDHAFLSGTSLTSIDIPDSVTSIGEGAFEYCTSLTSIGSVGSGASVEIPSGVTSIANGLFGECTGLTSVTIGNNVTSIGTYAFDGCSGLTSIVCNATTPPTLASANAFTNTNNCAILVPAASVNAYKTATNWRAYASRIQAIP